MHYDASHRVTLLAPAYPLTFHCRLSGEYYKTDESTMTVSVWPKDVDEMRRQGCVLIDNPTAPPPPMPTPAPGTVLNLGSTTERKA